MEIKRLGNIYGNFGTSYAGNVWDKGGLAPCLKTTSAASQQFTVVERKQNDIDRWYAETPKRKN